MDVMDIEIIIKGGVELSESNPKKYAALEEKITEMFMKFPEVGSVMTSREKWWMAQRSEQARQKARDQEFKTALIKVLQDPEIREKIVKVQAATPGA